MTYSFKSSFTRLTLVLLLVILALTAIGRYNALTGAYALCVGFPLCVPRAAPGWTQLAHQILAGVAALLVLWVFRRAWREQRRSSVVLPLATVMTVSFFGQAFIGALRATNPQAHLSALHLFSAFSLWSALLGLVFAAGVLIKEDAPPESFEARQRFKDFFALSKPLIVVLLLITTYGGLVAGSRALPSPSLTIWTLLGGALAAAGSSALNQYIDRELDKNMQRTAKRPLADGRLTPAEGLSYGLALCLISYYVMAGMVNLLAALLALAGIVYYVFFYSVWLKKATVQNIVIGGGAGAIPPMVGWAAATNNLDLTAWILFAIVFMWTPPHFWALAIVRAKDYERAGVPMLPVVRGEAETRKQILIYTVALVAVTLLLPLFGRAGSVYLALALIFGAGLLYAAWRVFTVGGNKSAWTMYRWSSMYLMLIFLAVIADSLA